MTSLRIDRIDLLHMTMQLRHPFVTSFGPQYERDVVLVRARTDGVDGWGELVAGRDPAYSEETVATALTIMRDHLLHRVLGRTVGDPRQLAGWWAGVRGNPMAKAAVEMAVWDLWSAATGQSLAGLLGGTRTAVPAGVSVGIADSTAALLDRVAAFVAQGYVRVKLKIAPGADVERVGAVRDQFDDVALMADANSAYTLADAAHLAQLDAFDLTMIEQPLAHDDIIDHASLASRLRTPLCLDESIRSTDDARRALRIGACQIINCKPGRLGGLAESLALHEWGTASGVPLWVGGMLESGVGRLHNIALASLPGFTLPGDTSASDRYWDVDIIDPAVTIAPEGTVAVPTVAGFDAAIDHERLRSIVSHTESFAAHAPAAQTVPAHTPAAHIPAVSDTATPDPIRRQASADPATPSAATATPDPTNRQASTAAATPDALRQRTSEMLDELRLLVEHESPTGDVDRLEALAAVLADQWQRIGATVTRHHVDGVGTHLELAWPGPTGTPADAPPALLIGHYDTVHDVGTLARNPWRVDDAGRAWGPGAQDMKSGLVIMRHALGHLQAVGRPLRQPVLALLTADEEVGSVSSSALIRSRARTSGVALVFEASTSSGALKTQRKGVGLWTVTARGRAAHAGQHFFDGRNANVALARALPRIAELSDAARGTTVNVGVMQGGTRANVVAAHAEAVLDVRFSEPAEAERVAGRLAALTGDDGVVLELEGGVNRPAMQRTAATAQLFARARSCARRLGFDLDEAAAGGASDGNFTAAEGTPTLDGLGGVGEGLHTDAEWVRVDSLPQRAALLAELLATDA